MPYVRRRGNQLAIVHGEREPGTGKVQQRILFTLYSKAEALEALGRRGEGGAERFRDLLEHQHPGLRFAWKAIRKAIAANLDVLPAEYEYRSQRLRTHFRADLIAFTRSLILADPQDLMPAAELISEHRLELEYLLELIGWRLKLREQEESRWNVDNPFYWRFALQGRDVPPDTEERAAGFYQRGEYDRAEAIFRLLVECFDGYAEGHNYLGLIALERERLGEAIDHFKQTIELGRKRFPARMAKKSYWVSLATRPYMRGLRNLALTLNQASRFDEALAICDQLETECGDADTATWQRAVIFLNTGRWQQASAAAQRAFDGGDSSLLLAFARFELGDREPALEAFLHAALNNPRAARMLVRERTTPAEGFEEASDHNTGVALLRGLHAYLAHQSAAARKFFRGVLRDPRVVALLDESIAVVRRRNQQHPTGGREAFDRMTLMRSRPFAHAEAVELRDLLGMPARGRPQLSLH